MLAEGTAGVIEIVGMSAFRAGYLRDSVLGMFTVLGCKKFQLSAGGAAVDLDEHRPGEDIGPVAQKKTGLAQLDVFREGVVHRRAAAQTIQISHHTDLPKEDECAAVWRRTHYSTEN